MEKKKEAGEEGKRALEEKIKEELKKEEEKKQNRILKGFLFIVAVVAIAFLCWIIISQKASQFEYRGVGFEVVDEIAPYRTAIPVLVNGRITGGAVGTQTDYYFYIRNDPRELDKIEFNGKIKLPKRVVIKSEKEFNCDGDGIIGSANLVKLYQLLGAEVVRDQEVICDKQERYVTWSFVEGDKTEIKEISPSCYEIRINDCEILKVTERFMIETFVEFNKVKDDVKIKI